MFQFSGKRLSAILNCWALSKKKDIPINTNVNFELTPNVFFFFVSVTQYTDITRLEITKSTIVFKLHQANAMMKKSKQLFSALRFKELLLKIRFNEMRTTWGKKGVLQALFHYFPYDLCTKIDLVRWLLSIVNSTFWNFVTSEKDDFANFLVE